MKALAIFLALVAVLLVLGYFYPSKTKKTPQNDRELRQGNSAEWAKNPTK